MKRLTPDQVKLGFIGLGNMGSRIAKRLLDHGYQLTAYDLDAAKAQAIAAQGGVVAKSILELARTADVLLSCLTNDEAVRSVFEGPAGIFAGARPGTIVLEMSTISPENFTRTAQSRRQRWRRSNGCRYLWQHARRGGRLADAAGRR
jgi:3-hydroxyisobutyrate dehydrogenase-like beta-hydroxyacid dehydrogenase